MYICPRASAQSFPPRLQSLQARAYKGTTSRTRLRQLRSALATQKDDVRFYTGLIKQSAIDAATPIERKRKGRGMGPTAATQSISPRSMAYSVSGMIMYSTSESDVEVAAANDPGVHVPDTMLVDAELRAG